jgi:hypothetical protein
VSINDIRIREIQIAANKRVAQRQEAATKLAERQANEEESRAAVSPRDLERQEAYKKTCEFWDAFHERERLKEYHRDREEAIAEMARLRGEWDKSTSERRKQQLLETYTTLYRKFEPKPNTTTAEQILAYWLSEKRKAALARIYGAR